MAYIVMAHIVMAAGAGHDRASEPARLHARGAHNRLKLGWLEGVPGNQNMPTHMRMHKLGLHTCKRAPMRAYVHARAAAYTDGYNTHTGMHACLYPCQ